MTTPYHPKANGLVERFHRRLKEALIALGHESPQEWFWRLPCVLLAIRTTVKPDVGASPADLVFGEGLAVPGEALPDNPATDATLQQQRLSALADARLEVSRLQPVQTSAHRRPHVHLPQELDTCTHIFVRRGGVQSTLASPYVGPFRVISWNTQNFKFAVPGRPNETVAIARVKPALCSPDDAEDNEPDKPPPPGRRPRPPRDPQPLRSPRPRRNTRRRRPRDDNDRPEDPFQPTPQPSPQPSPPPSRQPSPAARRDAGPHSSPELPLTRSRRRRRQRMLSRTPSPPNPPQPQWQSDDGIFRRRGSSTSHNSHATATNNRLV